MATRAALLEQIALLKEDRNLAILAVAPEDDVALGQEHPTVLAIEADITTLRDQLAALDAAEEE